jgi:hypothetical protein
MQIKDHLELYRWPLGQHTFYVTREAMLLKLLWVAIILIVIFGIGVIWLLLHQSRAGEELHLMAHGVDVQRAQMEFIKHCCLKDIRSTQEALTSLSSEAQKLRVRLDVSPPSAKEPSTQRLMAVLIFLTEKPGTLWDQLDSFVTDPQQNKRRQLRELRINMDSLVEEYHAGENCCGAASSILHPLMKEYLQIAAYRFGLVRLAVENNESEKVAVE